MRTIIKKRGNSASVRIPASVMQATKLKLDQLIDVREVDGCVVIEAVKSVAYDLDTLLAGMTPENLHEAADFGKPAGKEVW
jgi:antitoxin MazE